MVSDGPERRRAERIPINMEFSAVPEATYISDLSEYGVFVHTPRPAPLGAKIRLRFSVLLDDPVVISAEGRVVRHQGGAQSPGMGIEFTELDPETILRINDVVSRQRPRDSGPPLHSEDEQTRVAAVPSAEGTDDKGDVDESEQTGLFRSVEAELLDEDAE